MTQQHTIATAALTDRQYAGQMTRTNNVLRKRVEEQAADILAYVRLYDTNAMRIDALTEVNKALSTEVADLFAENARLAELAEQRRLDLVECRENMRGIRRHK